MALIIDCKVCGEKISLRQMAHGRYVAFDPNTGNPHKHINQKKKFNKNLNKKSKIDKVIREADANDSNNSFPTNKVQNINYESHNKKSNSKIIWLVIIAIGVFIYIFNS